MYEMMIKDCSIPKLRQDAEVMKGRCLVKSAKVAR